jgi:uncharacterized protein YbaP (TraB family)
MAKAAVLMRERGLYKPPDSLDKHLDPATLAKLQAALQTVPGSPFEMMKQMRPWFAAMTLALLHLSVEGFDARHGIDLHFRGRIGQRRFKALETVESQALMLSGMPAKMQLDSLRQTLDELDKAGDVMRSAFAAWKKGDAQAIDELMLAPFRKQYPGLYKRLFVDRNRRMTKEIKRLLAGKGTAFVVVGAGHLVGQDSIIRMLTTRTQAPKQL